MDQEKDAKGVFGESGDWRNILLLGNIVKGIFGKRRSLSSLRGVCSRSYLQMSWLDGETDVLEKLHGALTEVGLPACETAGEREKKNQQQH